MKIKTLLLLFMVNILTITAQEKKDIELQEVTVYNVSSNDCFTVEKLTLDSIKPITEGNLQISYLKTLPSITFHSDNGTESGYNYFRLRGIDQSKVNMTLNGVPLNEPEDGGFYFNNIGGLTNILDNMQVVNGATLTKNGSSTLAGSINMNTKRINSNYLDVKTSLGFYNTGDLSTTVSNKNKIVNSLVNYSYYNTDGYKYNSYNTTNTGSYIINKQFGQKFYLENIGIYSNQQNGMAWIGATKEQIKKDKRVNNNTNKEYDDFTTYTTQLIGKYFISEKIFLHTNLYYTHLDGKYTTDLDNLLGETGLGVYTNTLKQNWVGNFSDLSLNFNKLTTNIGYNTYSFKREHGGYDITESYSNMGYKKEFSPYLKSTYSLNKFLFTGNVQYRYVNFDYKDSNNTFTPITWNFINYGLGLTYSLNKNYNIYYSFGRNNKEASRLDMFGGLDYYDPTVFTLLPSEYVYDHEFGFRYHKDKLTIDIPFYYMDFKNELALNGLINQQGIHLHSSNESSKRYGVELNISYVDKLSFMITGNLSKNKLSEYNHILSPSQTLNLNLSYDVNNSLSLTTLFRYIGKCYIDPLNKFTLDPQYQVDLGISYKFDCFTMSLGVINITNKLNLTNGYMNEEVPYYFSNTPTRLNFKMSYNFKY